MLLFLHVCFRLVLHPGNQGFVTHPPPHHPPQFHLPGIEPFVKPANSSTIGLSLEKMDELFGIAQPEPKENPDDNAVKKPEEVHIERAV